MTVFWNIAPLSLMYVDRRYRGAYRPIIGDMSPDWGSKHAWNVGASQLHGAISQKTVVDIL